MAMSENRLMAKGRTLLAGKVISNFGQSTIDCVVRRLSDHGATISVERPLGIPRHFQLVITDEGDTSAMQGGLAIGQGTRIGIRACR
jgi:hypothetical protein